MLATVLLLWLVQNLWAWGTVTYNDLHYGRPRTTQMDAFVGHETGNTPSHFIALNWHGRAEVIEFPGGDASHAHIMLGPQFYGSGADLAPVTIQFVSTAQHKGQPNMLVTLQDTRLLFLNEHGTFVYSSQS
jgi:hypothetical protein